MKKYVLKGKKVLEVEDLLEWGRWMEEANRHVADDDIDGVRVSTVFLGINHNFSDAGLPLLFETMIFGGKHDGYQDRYFTFEQAEAGHKKALALVKMKLVK